MGQTFIICGSPGAGKTTYGVQLAQQRNAIFLDIDTVTERLVRLSLTLSGRDPNDRDSAHFKQSYRRPIYDTLFDIARQNLQWADVVIAGPFTREIRDPAWPEKLEALLGFSVEVHYVYCPPKIRYERLQQRTNPRDRAKLVDWKKFNKYYGTEEPPLFSHIYIDTASSGKLRKGF